MSSSKYFYDFCKTVSAFSYRDSFACLISRRIVSVLSNLSSPSLADELMRLRMSLAPSSILHTEWPLCPSNIKHEGQIILNVCRCTSSIECNSIRRLYCVDCKLQYQWVLQLSEQHPFVLVILFIIKNDLAVHL
jgi:hypothetical protein